MNERLIADKTDLESVALFAYWEFYHFVPLSKLDKVEKQVIAAKEEDIVTGLTVYESTEKTVLVDGVTNNPPLIVIVDDYGKFSAVYETREKNSIAHSPNARKAKSIKFTKEKWEIEVFEVFGVIPKIVVSEASDYRFITTSGAADLYYHNSRYQLYPKDDQSPYVYPCSVYMDADLINPAPSGWSYPDSYQGSGYWDGGNYVQHSRPVNQTQRDIKYFWDNRVQGKSMCGYDSTKEYVESMLGVVLHKSDREWYEKNDKVETNGLPIKHTLSVLSELVEPYGLEIDKVWVRDLVWTEEFVQFSARLGVDGPVRETLLKHGADLPPPRFFSGVEPKGPCIVMTKSTKTAYAGGHAEYCAPREKMPADWIMAVSYRRTR